MNKHIVSTGRKDRRLVSAMLAGLALILAGVLPAMAATSGPIAAPIPQQARASKTKLQAMTVAELLAAAQNAYIHGRLVAPASDNAIEYYEATLRKDSNNRVAKDALRESFPYAATQVEHAIAQDNFDEANREIALLAEVDPGNYTLTILRNKLDARQKLPGRQHVLILQAASSSWVEIANAGGNVIDSRILHPGETRTYRSARPLRVTLGNADGVKVSSDGKIVIVKTDPHAKVAHLKLFAAL